MGARGEASGPRLAPMPSVHLQVPVPEPPPVKKLAHQNAADTVVVVVLPVPFGISPSVAEIVTAENAWACVHVT